MEISTPKRDNDNDNDNDNVSLSNESEKDKEREKETVNFENLIKNFNWYVDNNNSPLRKITTITEKRKKAINALLVNGYTKRDIEKVFEMASKADFKGTLGCIPDFDWLIKEDNFVRIEEGNFQKGAQKKQVGKNDQKNVNDVWK